ncbi:hypothetical protein SAMN05216249_109123 [Acetitomaculum ruminis DSM 5522]|uniref:Uncharacterized protein n=1 Tax=Acetitomaculum ruminis DSM 5522 TaxID=1120918 RepID=A0A1I0YF20_9FIRM|nr:hypothetical protein [Acetitomaculum ruminis]SFB11356.1 hypothetical protein SAMN05216249_109123 [Acetitomaculum ruminis DSM 5522]
MSDKTFKITSVSEESRWIFLCYDEWDVEESDSFIELLKLVRADLKGDLKDLGMNRYTFNNDPLKLIYQWDSIFGIVVEYQDNKNAALDYLNRIISIP